MDRPGLYVAVNGLLAVSLLYNRSIEDDDEDDLMSPLYLIILLLLLLLYTRRQIFSSRQLRRHMRHLGTKPPYKGRGDGVGTGCVSRRS